MAWCEGPARLFAFEFADGAFEHLRLLSKRPLQCGHAAAAERFQRRGVRGQERRFESRAEFAEFFHRGEALARDFAEVASGGTRR